METTPKFMIKFNEVISYLSKNKKITYWMTLSNYLPLGAAIFHFIVKTAIL